jgi:hypothetical protein
MQQVDCLLLAGAEIFIESSTETGDYEKQQLLIQTLYLPKHSVRINYCYYNCQFLCRTLYN